MLSTTTRFVLANGVRNTRVVSTRTFLRNNNRLFLYQPCLMMTRYYNNDQLSPEQQAYLRMIMEEEEKEKLEASLGYSDVFPAYKGIHRPDASIEIHYRTSRSFIAHNGNILNPEQVAHSPRLHIRVDPNIHKKQFFSVLMINPDVPSRELPIIGEWINWLLVNIPNWDGEGDSDYGTEVVEYLGAAPLKDRGFNRYIFCVFAHDELLERLKLPKITEQQTRERKQFSAKKFAEKHRLGLPIVMDSFQAEWNEYVPICYPHIFPSRKIPNLFGDETE